MQTTLKRHTRIEYSHAGGKVVAGKVLGPYAPDMPGWFLCRLTDERGAFTAGCNIEQLRVTDNRLAA